MPFCNHCGSALEGETNSCLRCSRRVPQSAPLQQTVASINSQRILLAFITLFIIICIVDRFGHRRFKPTTSRAQDSTSLPPQSDDEEVQLAKMTDRQLLLAASKLLSANRTDKISLSQEADATSYLREFARRNPNKQDPLATKLNAKLASIRISRELMESVAKLDSQPPTLEAEAACRATVKQNLKAPSTADFVDDDYVKYLGKGKFDVQTTVDAQNSFGAKIRSNFDCKMQCFDEWHCSVTALKEF